MLQCDYRDLMADLLFDISGIDMDGVFLTPDQVAEHNPQRGDMRHLDHVIYMDENASKAVGVKMVRDDEFWVPGHIPGRPLLPAVLMIEAAAQLSSILYQFRTKEPAFLGFTRCDKAVFLDRSSRATSCCFCPRNTSSSEEDSRATPGSRRRQGGLRSQDHRHATLKPTLRTTPFLRMKSWKNRCRHHSLY